MEDIRVEDVEERKKRFLAFQAKWIALYGLASQFGLKESAGGFKNNAFRFSYRFLQFMFIFLVLLLYFLGAERLCLCDGKVFRLTVKLLLVAVTLNLLASFIIVMRMKKKA
ncbi:uncharacterized protein LOC106670795 [Cimex lectularius]|uniref:Uncharacterized protein n=1 Tax=Cimex lectularius TaxID=79782 RepID=A0A8I6TJT0_CIMLE|nr:uncharacterized protein LOC106670795 [Cimex lectularius]